MSFKEIRLFKKYLPSAIDSNTIYVEFFGEAKKFGSEKLYE